MILYPNAKINLGLHVIEKRPDGFHNIETVFYPVPFFDIIEVVENKKSKDKVIFNNTGLQVDTNSYTENLCVKAYFLLSEKYNLPPVRIHLHKVIPFGAGLGGGSADAAFVLKGLNDLFKLNLSTFELINIASQLGSDCAFFIENKPSFAFEKGNLTEEINLNLSGYYIIIVYPGFPVSTKDAYSGIVPMKSQVDLKNILMSEPELWKDVLVNDFEKIIFKKYPELSDIKNQLYNSGALYASMSGSGSAVFGIFNKPIDNVVCKQSYMKFVQKL